MLVLYGGWNAFFLVQGKFPDSVFRVVTGLPCPTTGGIRSIQAFARGEWLNAFLWNPFVPVFILLAGWSAVRLVRAWRQKNPLLLSRGLTACWFLALGGAWITKFILGSAYW